MATPVFDWTGKVNNAGLMLSQGLQMDGEGKMAVRCNTWYDVRDGPGENYYHIDPDRLLHCQKQDAILSWNTFFCS